MNKTNRLINLFWVGTSLFILFHLIPRWSNLSYVICQALQVIGMLLIIFSSAQLIRFKFQNKFLQYVFVLFTFWILLIVLRTEEFNYDDLKQYLLSTDLGVFAYLAPLIMLFPKSGFFYKRTFDTIFFLGCCSLLFELIFFHKFVDRTKETQDIIEASVHNLGITSAFILFSYKYHSTKRQITSIFILLISFLFAIYKARRGLSALLCVVLVFSYFQYLINSKRKILIVYLSVFITIIGVIYFSSIYNINNNNLLNLISDRGVEDTRTGIELYFYDDMRLGDWVFGRGINGDFFCPTSEEFQKTNYRDYIETGYLQIILKGGLISLFLYLIIAVPAIILGMFNSKNLLAKSAGLWIILALSTLYPMNINVFSLNYLLVWISIGICYSSELRNFSDEEVYIMLNPPKLYLSQNIFDHKS